MNHLNVELLSPAGTQESFFAAMASGADAVYAGCGSLNARAYAGNFTLEEFLSAMDYAHILGKKLYLTLNTLVKDSELFLIPNLIDKLYENGLDGVIVQDLGVIRLLRERYPDLPVHASTQMALTGVYGAKLLKNLGAVRIVTARELSLKEIRDISEKAGIEVECFIHGAMCYSYSGLCLMSSIIGGRSGNRGRCAGSCRQPYRAAGFPEGDAEYPLSMRDLTGIEYLPDLIEAGVKSLKIEGRMKDPAYVGSVTEIYRKYIDRYYESGRAGFKVEKGDLQRLVELYSRGGYNPGYFERHSGREMLTLTRGSYRTELPEDYRIEKRRLPIEGRALIKEGKPIRLSIKVISKNDRRKEFGNNITEIDKPGDNFNENGSVSGKTGFEAEETAALSGGFEDLFTESNNKVCLGAEATGQIPEKAKKRPLTLEDVEKQLNKTGDSPFFFEKLSVDISDNVFIPLGALNGLRRKALKELENGLLEGYRRELPKEKAVDGSKKISQGFSAANYKKLSEAGDTGFIDIGNYLPHIILQFENQEIAESVCAFLADEGKEIRDISAIISDRRPAAFDSLKNCLFTGTACGGDFSVDHGEKDITAKRTCVIKWIQLLPHIMREERGYNTRIDISKEADGFLIRNYEELQYLKEHLNQACPVKTNEACHDPESPDTVSDFDFQANGACQAPESSDTVSGPTLMADAALYTWNRKAVSELMREGVRVTTAPYELTRWELIERGLESMMTPSPGSPDTASFTPDAKRNPTDIIVYGRIPLMISAQCPYSTITGRCSRVSDREKNVNSKIKAHFRSDCEIQRGFESNAKCDLGKWDAETNRNFGSDKRDVDFSMQRTADTKHASIELRDRKNVGFPAITDCRYCVNVIYNNVPLSLHKDMEAVLSLKPESIRLVFTLEDEKRSIDIIKYYVNLIRGLCTKQTGEILKTGDLDCPIKSYTRGHFSRKTE